jgi:ferrochelatase
MNKKAVILMNMGGPNNLDEVEIFLKNMFNDKNIITVKSDLLRKFIAFMIVSGRKKEARENYEHLGGKSPIVENTKNLISALQKNIGEEYYITYCMRYTPPFAKDVIEELENNNIKDILLFPLYPQYSTTTTKSSLEDFYEYVQKDKFNIKEVEPFYNDEKFLHVIINQIKEDIKNKNSQELELIFSAHSLPQKIVDNGDPYEKQVIAQVELLKKILEKENIKFNNIHIAYQSKLGPVKWLEPQLENTIREFENKKVLIYPISFIIDNSETDFELSIEYKEIADELNYDEYLVSKCPNDGKDFVDYLTNKIKKYL